MSINMTLIKDELKDFIRIYKTKFDNLGNRQSQVLELGALAIATEHYRKKGYTIVPKNLQKSKFKVKTGAPGKPINFSWFECIKDEHVFEIHSNLPVFSYYRADNGVYVVDVGVINKGKLPDRKHIKEWKAVDNKDLITFIEAKSIVIYPMLLAQFIGIVHEIKPNFLGNKRPSGFLKSEHFNPALVSLGYLHGTSANIRNGYINRKYKLNIIPSFDIEIAKLRGGTHESPLSGV